MKVTGADELWFHTLVMIYNPDTPRQVYASTLNYYVSRVDSLNSFTTEILVFFKEGGKFNSQGAVIYVPEMPAACLRWSELFHLCNLNRILAIYKLSSKELIWGGTVCI